MQEKKALQSGWQEAREKSQGAKCQLGRDPVNNGREVSEGHKAFFRPAPSGHRIQAQRNRTA